MFGSSFLDIAIGISFVFLLLSLIASTINEIFLSFLNMRGRDLLEGLKTLLDDETGTGLVQSLYNHGLVFGLFKGDFDPNKKGNLPSYIPAANFAPALLDVVRDAAAISGTVQQGAAVATMDSIRQAALKLAGDEKTGKVGQQLVSMIDAAGTELTKLSKSVEDWYNSAMDRVSGAYKYRTQQILFGIGLVLAIALNADTVRIVKQLSKDSTLRQSIVAAAQSAKQSESTSTQTIQVLMNTVHDQVKNIEDIGIPLGWSGVVLPSSFLGWLAIFGGWLLTAIAVSLGAPFWFDTLNKFMIVRSTVKPGEKSQPAEPKDKQPKDKEQK